MSKTSQIIFTILEKALLVVEWVLVIRFTLRLLGASEAAWIVHVYYELTYFLSAPFVGIFPNWDIGAGMMVDWVIFSAIVAYAIVYFVIKNVYFHEKKGEKK